MMLESGAGSREELERASDAAGTILRDVALGIIWILCVCRFVAELILMVWQFW